MESKVRGQLYKLLNAARVQGHAIGIGHPYPQTVTLFHEELHKLRE
ncbi:MAG: divergent polysaccharide deacetylase family protein [Candidatus Thiodiazotropha sp. (ex Lucinoma aequizonata)]|nr:divergent polysaccharide deacetylase family protein [Candidatus Thiodiazotropha sp. (ex Lucinoma aequizonata)]MCU7899293.1 divergent polysaccharide deacetylase family protein [Candidatus Thiodiazotropha sp. (ex Lucinoma aequizonata)]MCU7901085.1 divergent polysaccharide deacetylase family protein [Candidatus Thiodiazotropha sp. (ex Lucinoma aequizonata)]MCU7910118.1 divergent polysaccharide deacetylase family protein [Candidatus Thiodiazotropha sp. (ex Lucinoma aequizonata)]MCU7911906.1 dive